MLLGIRNTRLNFGFLAEISLDSQIAFRGFSFVADVSDGSFADSQDSR
jgi:hypothetical protein